MRQRRWLELIKDYDSQVFYHPGKANVVANALSQKSRDAEAKTSTTIDELAQQFSIVRINSTLTGESPTLVALVVQPLTKERIKIAQENDEELKELIVEARNGEALEFQITSEGVLTTKDGWTVVPNDAKLKREILNEAHQTRYTVHPGNTKMYQDLKKKFWWRGMKRNVAEYVARCPSCQLVKVEHKRPAGPL